MPSKFIKYDEPIKKRVKTKEWYISQAVDYITGSVWIKRDRGPWIQFLYEQVERVGGEELTIFGHYIDSFGYPIYCIEEAIGEDYLWVEEMFENKLSFYTPSPEVEINPICI